MLEKTDYEAIRQNVQIVDYARMIGYTPVRVGRYYTLKEHDSMRIDPGKNQFYRNSTGEHGSVIDFAFLFSGQSKSNAIADLERMAGIKASNTSTVSWNNRSTVEEKEESDKKSEAELMLPEKAKTYNRVYAYLTKTRKIDKRIVDELVKRKMIYQEKEHGNCVFVSYENNSPVFACQRGTNTYRRFVGDISGSDETKGFMFRNSGKRLYITEGVIDALSFATILLKKQQEEKIEELPDFLALAGAGKHDAIYHHLRNTGYEKVYIALDNDETGKENARKIKDEIIRKGLLDNDRIVTLVPYMKDWNDDLIYKYKSV